MQRLSKPKMEPEKQRLKLAVLPKYVHQTPSGKFRVVLRAPGASHVQHLGTFDSVGLAAASVERCVGEAPTVNTRPSRNTIRVLKALSVPFQDWVPADLANLIDFRKANGHFRSAPGPLYLMAVVGKEDFRMGSATRQIVFNEHLSPVFGDPIWANSVWSPGFVRLRAKLASFTLRPALLVRSRSTFATVC
jgi:hypothetical protein